MTEFYTRNGDDGFTGYLGSGRLPKYDLRFEVLGAVDEASAALGMARNLCRAPITGDLLLHIQRDLYELMAEISADPDQAVQFHYINEARVKWLEEQMDQLERIVKHPKEFIVPGDNSAGAALDVARTVVRRAERRTAELLHRGDIQNKELLCYLNRLSSLCFVLELYEILFRGQEHPTLARM